jgi:hypothetical protein
LVGSQKPDDGLYLLPNVVWADIDGRRNGWKSAERAASPWALLSVQGEEELLPNRRVAQSGEERLADVVIEDLREAARRESGAK